MRIVTLLFVILLVILGAFFTALNAQPVVVNYLIGKVELPLAVLVLAPFILGILMASLFFGLRIFLLSSRNKRLDKKLKKIQNQVDNTEQLIRDIK